MERLNLLVETSKQTSIESETKMLNNYSSKSSSSDIITNTSSSSNSLTFTDDDDLSSSSGSALNKIKLDKNNETMQQSPVYSMLRVAAPLLPIRSTQNSSSSSSSSTSSSCSSDTREKQENTSKTNTKFIFILNAFVNGFAQLKLCADKIDYEYIIEIYWSNEAKSFVKRTFNDFVIFHRNLIQSFSQFFNEINTNNNQNSIINISKNSNRNSRLFYNNFDDYLMPILPASKKPFWVSHLKLAESREIELNSYVQRILKLPTQISHSQLVLKFFESQTSDPKPARFTMNLDLSIENRFFDDLEENTNDSSHTPMNTIVSSTTNLTNINTNESDIESNSNYDDEDEDDEDYDDNNSAHNFPSYLDNNNSNQLIVTGNQLNGNLRKKKSHREAGLWWDEDEALNELTSSMSFDFNNHMNQNTLQNHEDDHDEECYSDNQDKDDESVTLKTLEKILKNSDLFSNDLKENVTSSSNKILLNKNENQLYQRLSLS